MKVKRFTPEQKVMVTINVQEKTEAVELIEVQNVERVLEQDINATNVKDVLLHHDVQPVKNCGDNIPIRKVKGGYKWGKSGKVYPTRKQAEKQAAAAYASGYKKSEEQGEWFNTLKARSKKTKKDACYYKVKRRYKVWPSAYASGALVQCRKVGAKNWGNKKK